MKKILSVMMVIVMLLCLCACGNNGTEGNKGDGKYTIGILQQMPHEALDTATKGFQDAVKAGLGEENVEFILQVAQNDTTTCTSIAADFVSKDVDLIMANATTALQAAANATMDIPVLGTSVTEYGVALEIDDFNGTVGGNVSGTSDLAPLDQQAQMLLELYPETKKVAMLYCSAEPNSAYQVKTVTNYLTAEGVECADYSFADSNDLASVSAAAAAWADVIYIPTDNTAASYTETINSAIGSTPVVGGDGGICGGCGVATLCINYYDLGYATGEMAVKILKDGADISTMAIGYAKATKVYNKAKCEELGVDISALEEKGYIDLSTM